MKKYKIILSTILMLFLVACNTVEKTDEISEPAIKNVDISTTDKRADSPKSQIIINEKLIDKTSTFPFGMSKEEVMAKLDEMKVEVINEIEITTTQDDPEWGNKEVWAKGISFSFDKNNKLYKININGELPTSTGLKNGDSIEKMEKLYGENYRKDKTDIGFVYEYAIGDHHFRVFIETEKITGWGISK